MPATWKSYGVDANRDGRKDPFNPVDAIFAAARYLKAAGADDDLRQRDLRLQPRRLVRRVGPHARTPHRRAAVGPRRLAERPDAGPLPRLREGPLRRRPLRAQRDPPREARHERRDAGRGRRRRAAASTSSPRPARPSSPSRTGAIVAVGKSKRLGRYVQLRDVYGNTYTYAQLKKVATRVPVPKDADAEQGVDRQGARAAEGRPEADARRDRRPADAASARRSARRRRRPPRRAAADDPQGAAVRPSRAARTPSSTAAPASSSSWSRALRPAKRLKSYFTGAFGLDAEGRRAAAARRRARVIAGTVLGRIGTTSERVAPHVHFEIRPSGRGAPQIDPKPILDGWKLLEATAIYRAKGRNPLAGAGALNASIGQIMLMSKEALAAARPVQPAHRDLLLRPPRHRGRRHRPPRARDARVPRRQRPEADGHARCTAATATTPRAATSPSTRPATPSTSR